MTDIAGLSSTPSVQVVEKDEIGISGLKASDFLNMLVTQLQYQDPTEPTDSEQILTQVSQLRDLQSSTDLTDALQSMISGSELSNAAALIGQQVTGLDSAGETVQGTASSVRLVNGSAVLRVDGQDVSLTNVLSVFADTSSEGTDDSES